MKLKFNRTLDYGMGSQGAIKKPPPPSSSLDLTPSHTDQNKKRFSKNSASNKKKFLVSLDSLNRLFKKQTYSIDVVKDSDIHDEDLYEYEAQP